MRLPREAYNAIYRLRKADNGLSIHTRQRTIFYDINLPEQLNIKAAQVLLKEHRFVAQSELR